jgi:MYXO-CTERM domain-containing protein
MGICCGGCFTVTIAAPEPQAGTLMLAGLGAVGLLAQRRRRRANSAA